ncbi:MAG: glycosyltransferase 87 family protein [Acidimicrobiales bacterium]
MSSRVAAPVAAAVTSDGILSGAFTTRLRTVLKPFAIYVASRLLVMVTMLVETAATNRSLGDGISRWDSRWYLLAVTHGYPSHLPMVNGHVTGNTIAFFPGLPLVIRGLSAATGMSFFSAGVILSLAGGLGATLGVWALVRRYAGTGAADGAAAIFAFYPGAFVFNLIYSEGLMITAAAFGLLALMRRRWVTAGLLGAVATATSPVSVVFVLSAAWSAFFAIKERREWKAVAAVVIAPLGAIAYIVWLWAHTGTLGAFPRTERGGWKSYLSIRYPAKLIGSYFAHPFSSNATTTLLFFGAIVVVIAAVIAIRDRQPSVLLIYGIAAGVLALLTVPVGPRPRIILDAFPLVMAVGVHCARGHKFALLMILSIGLLVALTAYEVGSWSVFP